MKHIVILLILISTCFLGCTKKQNQKKFEGALASSVGKINDLTVVIDNELWKNEVGDTIRKYFGAEVPGLPQEEPLFSMRQIPPSVFSGFAQKARIFLKVSIDQINSAEILTNKFASPQKGLVISGKTKNDLIQLIKQNSKNIIGQYKLVETLEKQHRIKKSLERLPQIKEKFDITINVPSAYRLAKEDKNFIWLRKNIKNNTGQGDMNLIIYELPYKKISNDTNAIASIIKVRDSIGALKIPTDSGNFITEEAYAPYLFKTKLDQKFSFETKGTWEIKDRYMAGPFVNYMVEDPQHNRLLVLEGFVFAPSARKRDNMFELEAIIKTVKFH